MIFAALVAGAFAGTILLFFAHLAPSIGAGNFIRDLDQPRLLGKDLSLREAHFMGALLHLVLSAVFGGVYAYFVRIGAFADFGLLPLLGWSVIITLFTGGIILPLEGHGLFGVKEDAWFPVDLILTSVAWAVLFWWMITLWPGV